MALEEEDIYFSPYRVSTITCNANIGEDINLNLKILFVTFWYKFRIDCDKLVFKIGDFEYYFHNEDIINASELKKYIDRKTQHIVEDIITINSLKIEQLNKEIEHLRQFLNGE